MRLSARSKKSRSTVSSPILAQICFYFRRISYWIRLVVDDLSGTSIKTFCQRALEVHGDQRFSRLANISVSHIYNLRKSKVYQRCRRKFTKTQGVKINIGERCKPRPNGAPGHLRVDSVHQGDMDGKKGVYHINSVDEVTQWEVIVTVQRISAQFMIPALKSLLEQFPFLIKGFHADNGLPAESIIFAHKSLIAHFTVH